jgi:hypothetical protein
MLIGYYAAHAQEKQMSTVNEFIKNHGLNKVKPSILEMNYNGVTYTMGILKKPILSQSICI